MLCVPESHLTQESSQVNDKRSTCEAHGVRALLSTHKALLRKTMDLANEVRGLLETFADPDGPLAYGRVRLRGFNRQELGQHLDGLD